MELGTALWVTADEIAMPLVGLSQSTLRRPLEMHVQSFVAHLVYGVVTERVRHLAAPSAYEPAAKPAEPAYNQVTM